MTAAPFKAPKKLVVPHIRCGRRIIANTVTNPGVQTPQAEDYLPDWSRRRFIVLDATARWASPLTIQTAEFVKASSSFRGRTPEFETCETARETLLFCEQDSTLGVILFIAGIERDCLSLLGRLGRIAFRAPILAVCSKRHEELLPTLLEAGVNTALFDVVNDIPIARWCATVALRCAD